MNIDIEAFVEDCKSRGLTEHTIATYKSDIAIFLNYAGNPLNVDTSILRDFLNYLKEEIVYTRGKIKRKGVCSKTLNAYFSAISTYYDYLVYIKKLGNNPVIPFRRRYLARIKQQYNGENSRQLITIEQMKQLINQEMPIQHKAILMVLAKTGVRRGELIAMEVNDIDLEKKEIILKPKAKRTNRLVIFDDETVSVLKIFLEWRKTRTKISALFISPGGERIHRDAINQIISDYGSRLGLHDPAGNLNKKLTAHCFRHWFTTYLRRAGMQREFIQELRGDRRGEAMDIYNHIDMSQLKSEYCECMPQLLETPVGLHIKDLLPQRKSCIPVRIRMKVFDNSNSIHGYGELTFALLSSMKDHPEGLKQSEIIKNLNKKPELVSSKISRNLARGYLRKDETKKYYITPQGIETLELILEGKKPKSETPIKKSDDMSKEFMTFFMKKHPELIEEFMKESTAGVMLSEKAVA